MAFDALGRLIPTHKTWDHVGNLIPVVEHSEGIRPHGEFKPAAWLPVQFFDKHFEEYFVVMPGKIVACDNDGRLVPAGYGAATPLDVTYTATDVAQGVLDVRTGAALLAADTGTFTVASVDGTPGFMGEAGVAMAISDPIGVAPYPYWQWAGDGSANDDGFNPAGFRQHNHNLQHQVAVLCDYVLELPLVPATVAAEALTENTNAANLSTLNAVANLPLAKNTVRTPFTFSEGAGAPGDVAAKFNQEVATIAEIDGTGKWHVNLTTGVISVWSTGAIGATDYELVYSHYAASPATVSVFAAAVGDLSCGDFLLTDNNSNFSIATTEDFKDIMGQVLEIEDVLGKDALDRVRTAYNPAIATDATGGLPGYAGQLDQMPGSASGGAPDKVHYAGAANLVVRINLVSR
jgi:hypothetical protein